MCTCFLAHSLSPLSAQYGSDQGVPCRIQPIHTIELFPMPMLPKQLRQSTNGGRQSGAGGALFSRRTSRAGSLATLYPADEQRGPRRSRATLATTHKHSEACGAASVVCDEELASWKSRSRSPSRRRVSIAAHVPPAHSCTGSDQGHAPQLDGDEHQGAAQRASTTGRLTWGTALRRCSGSGSGALSADGSATGSLWGSIASDEGSARDWDEWDASSTAEAAGSGAFGVDVFQRLAAEADRLQVRLVDLFRKVGSPLFILALCA